MRKLSWILMEVQSLTKQSWVWRDSREWWDWGMSLLCWSSAFHHANEAELMHYGGVLKEFKKLWGGWCGRGRFSGSHSVGQRISMWTLLDKIEEVRMIITGRILKWLTCWGQQMKWHKVWLRGSRSATPCNQVLECAVPWAFSRAWAVSGVLFFLLFVFPCEAAAVFFSSLSIKLSLFQKEKLSALDIFAFPVSIILWILDTCEWFFS